MKKILSLMMVLFISINLIACSSKAQQANAYDFEYKFKEEYSDIDREIAVTFLEMVKGLKNVHDTVLDFENQKMNDEFSICIDNFLLLHEKVTASMENYSVQEIEAMKHMLEITGTAAKLGMLKAEYNLDKIDGEMGLKRKNTEEYYAESAQVLKKEIEKLFEETKKFID